MAASERSRPSLFWPLAAIVIPLVSLLAKIRTTDADKLPRQGAFVLAPNHYSEFDPLIVAVAVYRSGRLPRFMAKESLFRVPVLGSLLRATGMIPVARAATASAAKQTIAQAEALAEHGRGVIVYPEGSLTRDPDMWPMRGKTGAVRLAFAGEIPVIPVATWGVQEILPRYGKLRFWPPRRRVQVLLGPAVDLDRFRSAGSSALPAATDAVMADIAQLLAQLRGEPAPAQRWNPSDHGQKETGRLEP